MEAQTQPGTREDRGMLTAHLRSDGRHKSKLYVDGGPSSTQTVGHLRMEGREVFSHAVAMITDVVEDAFKAPAIPPPTSTGSCRTRPTSASSTTAPRSSACAGEGRHPPWTGTATPRRPRFRWRWRRAVADGRIKRGDLVMLEAMGGGFTWGAALLRW